MNLLILVLLETLPVTYGKALLRDLHNYDILRYEVRVVPGTAGLEVDCRLRVRIERPGPLRFLVSGKLSGLRAGLDGEEVEATVGGGAFETLVRLLARKRVDVPKLLTLRPKLPFLRGATRTFRLRYRWEPEPGGWFVAGRERVRTHLSGFWLPVMADEFFEAVIEVATPFEALAPGRRTRIDGGWRFASTHPLQVLPFVVGRFSRLGREAGGRRLEVLLPPGLDADPRALLADFEAVLATLEGWLGAAPEGDLRLVVAPPGDRAPSYCAGSFIEIRPDALPGRAGKARWLAHLAHECSHLWWGYKLATPVVGDGGTWLREGLAEWSGIKVAGKLLGRAEENLLFRSCFAAYLQSADLRRTSGGVVFANEPTLADATYLDDPAVAYLRGALVFRRIAAERGDRDLFAALRRLVEARAYRFTRLEDFRRVFAGDRTLDYYVRTTRLPDLALQEMEAGEGRLLGLVACRDLGWPGGKVAVRVETTTGSALVEVEVRNGLGQLDWRGRGVPLRAYLDEERIQIDPIVSNNVWQAR